MSAIPHQATCDMTRPEEHFLWGISQTPIGTNMMPIQPQLARTMSKHLYELGFRHHPELQTKKLQLPVRGQQTFMNGLARWVPMDSEEPNGLLLPDVESMTAEEREWVHKELKHVGHIEDPAPDLGPTAQTTDASAFIKPFIQRVTSASEL